MPSRRDRQIVAGENWKHTAFYFDRARFFPAVLAASLPRAVRVFFGKCAIVLFRRAALAAFLMLRFAAVRCFRVAMLFSKLLAIYDRAAVWM